MKKNKKINDLYKKQYFKQKKDLKIIEILPEALSIGMFLLFIAAATIFFANFRYYQIKQVSMKPLFNNYADANISDGVFVRMGADFEVGDIVVLNFEETTLIKRVIATGGDKIAIVKKEFPSRVEYLVQRIAKGTTVAYTMVEDYINFEDPHGMKIVYTTFTQAVIGSPSATTEVIFDGEKFVTYLVLAEDEVFYLGDNRGNSLDSSKNGPAKVKDVLGKVEIVIWKEQNYLFNVLAYFFGFKNI